MSAALLEHLGRWLLRVGWLALLTLAAWMGVESVNADNAELRAWDRFVIENRCKVVETEITPRGLFGSGGQERKTWECEDGTRHTR